jgi:hypothetical protein
MVLGFGENDGTGSIHKHTIRPSGFFNFLRNRDREGKDAVLLVDDTNRHVSCVSDKNAEVKGGSMLKKLTIGMWLLLLVGTETAGQKIHTVLPIDAIPAIFSPKFLPANEAAIHKDSPVIGVSIKGEQHAYSMVLLNSHEIVNDVVGGKAIASTW